MTPVVIACATDVVASGRDDEVEVVIEASLNAGRLDSCRDGAGSCTGMLARKLGASIGQTADLRADKYGSGRPLDSVGARGC